MAWPPPTLPTSRTDTTVMAGTHPADHNAVNLAVNDIVAEMRDRGCALSHSQLIGSGSATAILWSTEIADVHGWHSANSADCVVPAGKAGRYTISLMANAPGVLGAANGLSIFVNGAAVGEDMYSSLWSTLSVTVVRTLAVGDVIRGNVYQSTGSNVTIAFRLEIR